MIQKISIIIPVYNEAATIEQLLANVWSQPLLPGLQKEIILVESNSSDGTRALVQKFVAEKSMSRACEVRLILQSTPRGKGNAMQEGLRLASGDIILIQDGDLEYDTADYPQLIMPIVEGHADFVLGSRHLSAGSWKIRKFTKSPIKAFYMNLGGSLFHTLFNTLYGVKLTDPTTMYKVFLRDCIQGIRFESNRFDFDFELLAKLIKLGYNPLEVPVSYTSRGFDSGKKVNILRDPFMWLWAIFKFRIKKIHRLNRVENQDLMKKTVVQEWRSSNT